MVDYTERRKNVSREKVRKQAMKNIKRFAWLFVLLIAAFAAAAWWFGFAYKPIYILAGLALLTLLFLRHWILVNWATHVLAQCISCLNQSQNNRIDEVASCMEIRERRLRRWLKRFDNFGLISSYSLDIDGVLAVYDMNGNSLSATLDDKAQWVEDKLSRRVGVICPTCGAHNEVYRGFKGVCEYCGNFIEEMPAVVKNGDTKGGGNDGGSFG